MQGKSMRDKSKLLIPSLADVLFVTLFLVLSFSAGKGLLADGDTGYHIRAGEIIIDTLSVPKYDMFSFVSPPLPWMAHEWLSEVIMAFFHRAFGLTGVVIFFSLFISFTYYLLFKIIRTYKGNIFIAALIIALVIASSQIHWLARPHIFSLFLMVILYYLLDLYQYNGKNYLYFLLPLMLLWVNLHGGFILGFIFIGIYFIGNFIKFLFSQEVERTSYKKKTRILGLTTVACLLVSLINPYSYHILLFPFKLISEKFLMDHVMEFLSPNFHESAVMPFKYLLFLMIMIIAVSGKRLNFIELVLVFVFTNMALYSARYIPLFAIIAAPILTKQAELILKQPDGKFINFFKKRSDGIAAIDASAKGYLWPVAAVLMVAAVAAAGRIEYKFDEEKKPVAAVEFLKKVHLKGNMFNEDEIGDYIIYSAYPQYKVFTDGRSDMYGAERVKEWFKVGHFKPGWEKIIEKYNINWIIFNADSVLSRFLIEKNDWKLIYADKVANIFVKNIPENQYLINQYSNVKPIIVEDKGDESM
jgi:hypothetical protein